MTLRDAISVSQLRQHIKSVLDELASTRQPLRITRRNGEDMVVLPLSDYESLDQTAYLLRSPANAEKLDQAITRSPEDRRQFSSIDDLKHALGD